MTDIDKTLALARKNSEGFGQKYGAKETADDYLKTVYATLYPGAKGDTVGERDAWVRRQEEYHDAIQRKQNCYADWKTAETYVKLLFAEVEVYRTKCANDRSMDRLHQ